MMQTITAIAVGIVCFYAQPYLVRRFGAKISKGFQVDGLRIKSAKRVLTFGFNPKDIWTIEYESLDGESPSIEVDIAVEDTEKRARTKASSAKEKRKRKER